MVLLYMVLHESHQYTPVMLAYIPAPWIRHGIVLTSSHFFWKLLWGAGCKALRRGAEACRWELVIQRCCMGPVEIVDLPIKNREFP